MGKNNNESDSPFDSGFKVTEEIRLDERNGYYTTVIKTCSKFFVDSVEFKTEYRKKTYYFFVTLLCVIIVISLTAIFILIQQGLSLQNLAAVATSAGTIISAIIVLPAKIVEFIFNKDEDKMMAEIIKSTQEFDKNNK